MKGLFFLNYKASEIRDSPVELIKMKGNTVV